MQDHQDVVVIDVGWKHFATLITFDSWAVIPNLNPNACLVERNLQLKSIKDQYQLSPQQLQLIAYALRADQQKYFRLAVRQGMLQCVADFCQDYRVVVTETLDVASLYLDESKAKVIEDLGWRTILEDLQNLLEVHQLSLKFLPREYNSLRCPNCRNSHYGNRLKNRFQCKNCDFSLHPDLIAGLNMQARWLTPRLCQPNQ